MKDISLKNKKIRDAWIKAMKGKLKFVYGSLGDNLNDTVVFISPVGQFTLHIKLDDEVVIQALTPTFIQALEALDKVYDDKWLSMLRSEDDE